MRFVRFGLTVTMVAMLSSTARAANDPPPAVIALVGGTLLRQAIDICRIDVSPDQLAIMTIKLTKLKTQVAAVLDELPLDALAASDCPGNSGHTRLTELIAIFNEKSSEEFASAFKQFSDTQATSAQAALPTPARPAPTATPPAAAAVPSAPAEIAIGGWQVTRRPNEGVCSAIREYKDPDDDDKDNAVGFFIHVDRPDNIVISFGYEGWEWSKDEKITADFKIDRTMIFKKSIWKGSNKTTLTGSFDSADAVMDKINGGQKLFLTFDKNSEANFLVANVGLALGGVKICLAQK